MDAMESRGSMDWNEVTNKKRPRSNDSSSSSYSEPDRTKAKRHFQDLVHLSFSSETVNFRMENPLSIKRFIDDICGTVKKVFPGKQDSLNVFCDMNQANLLLPIKNYNGKPIKIEKIQKDPVAKGVIHGVPLDIDEESLGEITAPPNYVISNTYRIKNRTSATKTVVISFKADNLPMKVFLGYKAFHVHTYIPKPIRCFKCQRFGHMAKNCKSNLRCPKCGDEHSYNDCKVEELKCCNCGGTHSAAYHECPQYKTRQEIIKVSTVNKISYSEAVKNVKSRQTQNIGHNDPDSQPSVSTSIPSTQPAGPIDTDKLSTLIASLFKCHYEGKLEGNSTSDLVKNTVKIINSIFESIVDPATVFKTVSKIKVK